MSVMFDPQAAIYPFPPKPTPLNDDEKQFYREKIKRLLKERNAVMVAHYYTDPEIQQLAEETGGPFRHEARRIHAAGSGRTVYGGNRQNPQPGKDHSYAYPGGGMFAGFRLPNRRI